MNVSDAVRARRSVRAFLDRPVDRAVIERVLTTAGRAPSGGNLQPWHLTAVTGTALKELVARMEKRLVEGGPADPAEYPIYPSGLTAPYRDRRFRNAEQLYTLLGIPREEKAARRAWFSRNYRFFGAPVGLFCYVHRQMGAAQWADLGMYLQSVMLLLQEEGLSSCPQEAWSLYHTTVARVVRPDADHMLFCGMAIGHADVDDPVNSLRTERASLDEVVTFLGWET